FLSAFPVFSFPIPRPPPSTLFPYTTLFRSSAAAHASRPSCSELANTITWTGCPITHDQRSTNTSSARHLGNRGTNTPPMPAHIRSEEHTSELQSRFDLVCRLLLEKKKKNQPDMYEVSPASMVLPGDPILTVFARFDTCV